MNEDDTFKALTRVPFSEVINRMRWTTETYENAYCTIVNQVNDSAKPSEDWHEYAPGWNFEDFKKECAKRKELLK